MGDAVVIACGGGSRALLAEAIVTIEERCLRGAQLQVERKLITLHAGVVRTIGRAHQLPSIHPHPRVAGVGAGETEAGPLHALFLSQPAMCRVGQGRMRDQQL